MDWRSTSFFLFNGAEAAKSIDVVKSDFAGFLDAYAETGLNTVALTWFMPVDVEAGVIAASYASDVPDYLQSLPSNDLLTTLTGLAHDRGFKVMWKPHFVTNDAQAGNINPYYTGAGFDAQRFLGEVDSFWKQLAPVAEAADTDLLILGTEHAE